MCVCNVSVEVLVVRICASSVECSGTSSSVTSHHLHQKQFSLFTILQNSLYIVSLWFAHWHHSTASDHVWAYGESSTVDSFFGSMVSEIIELLTFYDNVAVIIITTLVSIYLFINPV
jgi:hypothetical protein